MKRVFVTGGSGFLGKALITRLIGDGVEVVALARSPTSRQIVEKLGASPCNADLSNVRSLSEGMKGCDTVFHVAAHFTEWDDYQVFYQANVVGTDNMLEAAGISNIATFVAAGAAGVVMGRPEPLLNIREEEPLQFPSWAPYTSTKAIAEQHTLEANSAQLRTLVVRPPMIWGSGMPMLEEMLPIIEAGQFALPGGGEHLISTSHVQNVVQVLLLAAEHGHGGQAYFVTDGQNITFKQMVADLVGTRGMSPIKKTAPFGVAWAAASIMELLWRMLGRKSKPPLTRQMLRMIGKDFTLDDTKARRDLGYKPIISRSEGLAGMRQPVT